MPILPMSLFANRNFAVASSVGFIVGLSLFGAVTFLPIYLQVVKGVSPSTSGLMLMPMMLGMLVTSIISGRLISRFGRYKLFPILGTASMTFGFACRFLTFWVTVSQSMEFQSGVGSGAAPPERVRRAPIQAIDRQTLTRTILDGLAPADLDQGSLSEPRPN